MKNSFGLQLMFFPLIISFLFPTSLFSQDNIIEVSIKGIDDGKRTNKQNDYTEALMNARLQAIERAGVEITSITKVENFKLKYDMIESKAKAVLLPGFQVMDIGYQRDGTYLVILVGKVRLQQQDTLAPVLGKEAYKALKRLEAKCQTGIRHQDYGAILGDAKYELNLFLESQEAKDKPELAGFLMEAMKYYEEAKEVWSSSIRDSIRLKWTINPEGLAGKWRMASDELKSAGALISAYERQKSK